MESDQTKRIGRPVGIGGLSAEEKGIEVLRLRFECGMTNEAIAVKLGTSPQRISQIINRMHGQHKCFNTKKLLKQYHAVRNAYEANYELMIKASKAGYPVTHKRHVREERRLHAEEMRLYYILKESGAL